MAIDVAISWLQSPDEAYAKARLENKLVLIDLFNPG
jgi:hypothetical protein